MSNMKMTIDEAIKVVSLYDGSYALDLESSKELKKACDVLIDTARKYQRMQVDHEVRLKADMIAITY